MLSTAAATYLCAAYEDDPLAMPPSTMVSLATFTVAFRGTLGDRREAVRPPELDYESPSVLTAPPSKSSRSQRRRTTPPPWPASPSLPPSSIVASTLVPPELTSSIAPLDITWPLSVYPSRIISVPPELIVKSFAVTSSINSKVPPLSTTVPTTVPPGSGSIPDGLTATVVDGRVSGRSAGSYLLDPSPAVHDDACGGAAESHALQAAVDRCASVGGLRETRDTNDRLGGPFVNLSHCSRCRLRRPKFRHC